jgi:hypothetical protein
MAIWGDGQKLCRLLIEVFATPATICDKTLTRQQNHVAKHPRLQHPGLKPKHVERLYAIAGFNAEELTPKYPDFIKDLKVLDIAKTITTLRVHMPNNRSFYTKTMFLTDDHKTIRPLFEVEQGKL